VKKAPTPLRITVCMGSSCYLRGNNGQAVATLRHCVEAAGYHPEITGHLCENMCSEGPNIAIEETVYTHVQSSCMAELLKHHLAAAKDSDG